MKNCDDAGNGRLSHRWMWNYFPLIFVQGNSFLPTYSRAALKQLFTCYINMYEKMFMTRLIPSCISVLQAASEWISNANQTSNTSTWACCRVPYQREKEDKVQIKPLVPTVWQICALPALTALCVLWMGAQQVFQEFLISLTFSSLCSR